jgi:4-oxalocrotonate tautomerase
MPLVEVTIAEGRRPDQIRALIHELHAAVVRAVGAPSESVRVPVREIPAAHWAVGDVTIAERRVAKIKRRAEFFGHVTIGTEVESPDRCAVRLGGPKDAIRCRGPQAMSTQPATVRCFGLAGDAPTSRTHRNGIAKARVHHHARVTVDPKFMT